jgi:hypothetical protein
MVSQIHLTVADSAADHFALAPLRWPTEDSISDGAHKNPSRVPGVDSTWNTPPFTHSKQSHPTSTHGKSTPGGGRAHAPGQPADCPSRPARLTAWRFPSRMPDEAGRAAWSRQKRELDPWRAGRISQVPKTTFQTGGWLPACFRDWQGQGMPHRNGARPHGGCDKRTTS